MSKEPNEVLARNRHYIEGALLYRITQLQSAIQDMERSLTEENQTIAPPLALSIQGLLRECRQMLIEFAKAFDEIKKTGFFN